MLPLILRCNCQYPVDEETELDCETARIVDVESEPLWKQGTFKCQTPSAAARKSPRAPVGLRRFFHSADDGCEHDVGVVEFEFEGPDVETWREDTPIADSSPAMSQWIAGIEQKSRESSAFDRERSQYGAVGTASSGLFRPNAPLHIRSMSEKLEQIRVEKDSPRSPALTAAEEADSVENLERQLPALLVETQAPRGLQGVHKPISFHIEPCDDILGLQAACPASQRSVQIPDQEAIPQHRRCEEDAHVPEQETVIECTLCEENALVSDELAALENPGCEANAWMVEEEANEIEEDRGACPGSGMVGKVQEAAIRRSEELIRNWSELDLSEEERQQVKDAMVSMFKANYIRQKIRVQESKAADRAEGVREKTNRSPETDLTVSNFYDRSQSSGLKIVGGHRHMAEPDGVQLPASHFEFMGEMTVHTLGEHDCSNKDGRFMLSVYGYVFDVSARPDKYGPEGPYSELTGKDITWGLFTANDGVECCNRFYDIFKVRTKSKARLERGLTSLCNWLAWYETEYGAPVGFLENYVVEQMLPAPPYEELEDCVLM